jgi:hypothetical protein
MKACYVHWVFNALCKANKKVTVGDFFLNVPGLKLTANISLQDPGSWPSNRQQPAYGLAYQVDIR